MSFILWPRGRNTFVELSHKSLAHSSRNITINDHINMPQRKSKYIFGKLEVNAGEQGVVASPGAFQNTGNAVLSYNLVSLTRNKVEEYWVDKINRHII